ncbi:MAG: hypothetical protein DBY09_06870 [Selenomonadales bacterium]|nr:MAG: hypothetical protein DBY09_06870 [Selenomonadales bacterium]
MRARALPSAASAILSILPYFIFIPFHFQRGPARPLRGRAYIINPPRPGGAEERLCSLGELKPATAIYI